MESINDLRVVDLKAKLKLRNLNTNGVKAELIERLREAMMLEENAAENCTDKENSDENLNSENLLDFENIADGEENGVLSNDTESLGQSDLGLVADHTPELSSILEQSKTCDIAKEEQIPDLSNLADELAHTVKQEEYCDNVTENPNHPENDEIKDEGVCHEDDEDKDDEVHGKDTSSFENDDMENRQVEDESIKLLLEDDDKFLDYEENDRSDTDDVKPTTEGDGKLKTNTRKARLKAQKKRRADQLNAAKNENLNIWVSGLTTSTKAQDLKALFSKHAKVLSAKIVTNSKVSGGKCFGLITVNSSQSMSVCIEKLNETELNGQTILVEQFKGGPANVTQSKPVAAAAGSPQPKKAMSEGSAPATDNIGEETGKNSSSTNQNDRKRSQIRIKRSHSPRLSSEAGEENAGEDSKNKLPVKERLGRKKPKLSDSRSSSKLSRKVLVAGNIMAKSVEKAMEAANRYEFDIDVVCWPYENMAGIFEKLHPLIKEHHEYVILFGLTYDAWMHVPLLANKEKPKVTVKNPNFNLESVVMNMNNFVLYCKNINPSIRVILVLPTVQDMFSSNLKSLNSDRKLIRFLKKKYEMAEDSRTIHRMIQSLKEPAYMWPDKIVFSLHDVLESLGHGKNGYNKDVSDFLSGAMHELGCRKSLTYGLLPTRFLLTKFWSHFNPFYNNLRRESRNAIDGKNAQMSFPQLPQIIKNNIVPRSNNRSRDMNFMSESGNRRRGRDRERSTEREKLRNLERRQKEEAYKLKRERQLLALEREKVEREKEKLLRLEREQQRLERERLEREREELRRQQKKYEEELRRGSKRGPPSPPSSREFLEQRRKMSSLSSSSSSRDFRGSNSRRSSPPSRSFRSSRRSPSPYSHNASSSMSANFGAGMTNPSMGFWQGAGNPMAGNQWAAPGSGGFWSIQNPNLGQGVGLGNGFPAPMMNNSSNNHMSHGNKFGGSRSRFGK